MILVVMAGSLALNGSLIYTAQYRQSEPVAVAISRDVDVATYECRVGVPIHLRHLIGQEVYFFSEGLMLGPWLVADVESVDHAGYMLQHGLIDTDCNSLVHRAGLLLAKERSSELITTAGRIH